jgi:hypothetical protein
MDEIKSPGIVRGFLFRQGHVRFGSKADVTLSYDDIRFTPKAHIDQHLIHVCFVPRTDMSARMIVAKPIVRPGSMIFYFVGNSSAS